MGCWKGMLESWGGEGQRRGGGTIGAVGGLFNEEGIFGCFPVLISRFRSSVASGN